MLSNESEKPAHKRHQALLASIEPKHRIPDAVFKQIAALHNSMVGHWGLQKCREFLNDPTITDRTIIQFIRQCPCCQVMSRLKILIKTHPFTCASYNPFESLHIDYIGPLSVDDEGNTHILGRLIPHQDYGRVRGCRVHFQHFGRFGTPDINHTNQDPASRNELLSELARMSEVEHSFATAYSKEENGLVECANVF